MTDRPDEPSASLLGRATPYPRRYDPDLLHPIARATGRAALPPSALQALQGTDFWTAFELSWLGPRGMPRVAVAEIAIPCASPNIVESKSLKLYLNSFNASRFADADAVRARIAADLSQAAGAPVAMAFGLPPFGQADAAACIDDIGIDIASHGPPEASLLVADPDRVVEETLASALLKSNCPVTGQPDWADLAIRYRGPRIDRAGLLRYVVGFRDHAEFHEQCVERIFVDVLARCAPEWLSVEARYTRRGGLDINPWRASAGIDPPVALRALRQ